MLSKNSIYFSHNTRYVFMNVYQPVRFLDSWQLQVREIITQITGSSVHKIYHSFWNEIDITRIVFRVIKNYNTLFSTGRNVNLIFCVTQVTNSFKLNSSF